MVHETRQETNNKTVLNLTMTACPGSRVLRTCLYLICLCAYVYIQAHACVCQFVRPILRLYLFIRAFILTRGFVHVTASLCRCIDIPTCDVYAYVYMYMYIYNKDMRMNMCITHAHVHLHVYVCIYANVYVYMLVYVYACMFTCARVYTYRYM